MFSKTVFSIARSTFQMYSVMAIFKSSIVWGLWSSGAQRLFDHLVLYIYIQGDQKVSVHLMITLQKVTSNVQRCPPPVSRHLLTRRTVFSKTVFSIARYTFQMCPAMAIFKSSIMWVLFEYTESGAQRLFDKPAQISKIWRSPENYNEDSSLLGCYKRYQVHRLHGVSFRKTEWWE